MLPSKPIAIPGQTLDNEMSYREIIKQLAQTTAKPYGDIPPMMKTKKKKRSKKDKAGSPTSKPASPTSSSKPIRRMSHVEDWIVVDSKESLPDEEELVYFFTEVLPLHMPPPSLSEQHSISSFTSSASSTTTTASYAVSSSPPHLSNTDHELWKETLAKLKRSLFVSPPPTLTPVPVPPTTTIPPARSEATTQPRFNPDTNTYTRDTRSNPDHLRMISAELNMMRGRKLLSPLKPRGFLPRRKDAFVRGARRNRSHLMQEIMIDK
ncbi:hypothetical protein BD408DRAFT_334861 [Parasitella parasitica]|nr:hypothetical protein BD408DRAFT_334861 [Parasitella parasitica]